MDSRHGSFNIRLTLARPAKLSCTLFSLGACLVPLGARLSPLPRAAPHCPPRPATNPIRSSCPHPSPRSTWVPLPEAKIASGRGGEGPAGSRIARRFDTSWAGGRTKPGHGPSPGSQWAMLLLPLRRPSRRGGLHVGCLSLASAAMALLQLVC